MINSHPLLNKRILVTGGSGFIGTNLVAHLHALGCTVKNLDIATPRNKEHLSLWENIDICNENQFKEAVLAFDPHIILHFAARTDLQETRNLSEYSENYLPVKYLIHSVKQCKKIEHIIFASSQLVALIEDQTPNDEYYSASTLYGTSKVVAEQIIRSTNCFGIPWTIVRPTSIWGPWFGTPYKEFFETIRKGFYFNIGSKNTKKQWGFVGNATYQIEKILTAPMETIHGKTFYLADFSPVNLKDFANAISKEWNNKHLPILPYWIAYTFAVAGDMLKTMGWSNPPLTRFRLHNIVSNEIQNLSSLEKVVGLLPYTPMQGIKETINWMRTSHPLQ
ncbi:MAG: NAD-dependent epimerase/dehydratase family protein [Anaerolineaceae bacterium]|nr:NAD-dependent epimerase/dehydratase family protein [Anaerolineaceae bacterium]